jgi:hypothetical protein
VEVVTTRQQMRDQLVVAGGGGLRRGLPCLDVLLAFAISTILNRLRRTRGFGGGRAVALGDEVAEADYTSLGHWSGVSRERSERTDRRDS